MSNEKYETATAALSVAAIDGAQMMIESLRKDREYVSTALAAARLEIESLKAKNLELERVCDATYVTQGADAYNHACSMMEQYQAERKAARKEVGTERSLCDGISWLYTRIASLESQLEDVGTGGWMRNGALLYRLTDERRPANFDEIRVTMANGSRDIGQMSAQAERLLVMLTAPQPAPGEPRDPSITLDFKMATELLKMFGEEPGLVTLQHGSERSHSGAGLYAWYSNLPEHGAEFLGAEPDDEAVPEATPAQPVAWQVNHIADHVADNWPMRKYALAEIEQRLRGIPAAPQPAAQVLDAARVFWQQHTQADALSMTMAELHTDVELVIRAARGSAQAAPVEAQHSTACLYHYALSRLGLMDNTGLRVLFWDAHNRLSWDSKTDWYVTPDADKADCGQCNAARAAQGGNHD